MLLYFKTPLTTLTDTLLFSVPMDTGDLISYNTDSGFTEMDLDPLTKSTLYDFHF